MSNPQPMKKAPDGRKSEEAQQRSRERAIAGNAAAKAAHDNVLYQEQMARFMEEPIELFIYNTEKEDENYPVPISVNGETVILKRNEWHKLPRKFLMALRNATIETFRTEQDPINPLINITIPVVIQRFPHTSREIGETIRENARIAEKLADAEGKIKELESRIQQMLKEGAHGGLVVPEAVAVDA